jgi:hypothetical protein
VKICNGTGFWDGCWAEDNLWRVVDDDVDAYFWFDPWLRGFLLKEWFKRLFELSMNQGASVAYIFSLGGMREDRRGMGGVDCLCWRRSS